MIISVRNTLSTGDNQIFFFLSPSLSFLPSSLPSTPDDNQTSSSHMLCSSFQVLLFVSLVIIIRALGVLLPKILGSFFVVEQKMKNKKHGNDVLFCL